MKLLASVAFDADYVENLIREDLAKNGYVLTGPLQFEHPVEGAATVRAMDAAEREAHNLPPENPLEEILNLIDALAEAFVHNAERLHAAQDRNFRQLEAAMTDSLQQLRGPTPSSSRIPLVTPADYAGGYSATAEGYDGEDPDAVRARQRLDRIRREQYAEPDLYAGAPRTDEGYVRIRAPKK